MFKKKNPNLREIKKNNNQETYLYLWKLFIEGEKLGPESSLRNKEFVAGMRNMEIHHFSILMWHILEAYLEATDILICTVKRFLLENISLYTYYT